MGRYIDDILQPGEKVLYSTNAHWIFFLPAIIGWIVAAAFFVVSGMVPGEHRDDAVLSLAAISAIFALYKTATAWFHRWTTETDVTNLRVVHKTGFIQRQTFEMSLDKVESVDVNQSILGRIFNYGDVTIFGVGEGGKTINTIASPLRISQRHHRAIGRRAIHGHAAKSRQFLRRVDRARPAQRRPRSIPPRSRNSRNCRTSGGIPTARWRRCTRSIRCG